MQFQDFLTDFKDLSKDKEKIINNIKSHGLPIMIYGVAQMSKYLTDDLKTRGVNIAGYVADDDYYIPEHLGLPVIRFSELVAQPEKYVVILGFDDTAYGGHCALDFLHNDKLIHYALAQAVYKNIEFDDIANNLSLFEETYNSLADDKSREVMVDYVRSNLSGDWSCVNKHSVPSDEYFNSITKSAIIITGGGCYIDCGAWRGDTIEKFIKFSGDNYSKILGIEPDPKNFAKLENFVDSKKYRNVELFNGGVWDKKGQLSFVDSVGTMGSTVSESGNVTIAVDTIDNLVGSERVNFIKMDIEGSELQALHGAAETVKRDKPILVICVYHRPNDLITIPQYIKNLNNDYKLYLRYHKNGCMSLTDLVLYTIP